jgi:hypothetical protein
MRGRGDRPVTVWCGNYAFGRDDSVFPNVVDAARKYADKDPGQRPEEARFREEIESLRGVVPTDGQVLLDQLEHRWRHPYCPPCLYVLTCTLRAPEHGVLLDAAGEPVEELLCTKVGQAKRAVAARIERYKSDVLGRVSILAGSPTLRIVIYGDGAAMLLEHEVQHVAKNHGLHAEVVEQSGVRRRVGDETYVGVGMIDAICAFARDRLNALVP